MENEPHLDYRRNNRHGFIHFPYPVSYSRVTSHTPYFGRYIDDFDVVYGTYTSCKKYKKESQRQRKRIVDTEKAKFKSICESVFLCMKKTNKKNDETLDKIILDAYYAMDRHVYPVLRDSKFTHFKSKRIIAWYVSFTMNSSNFATERWKTFACNLKKNLYNR